MNSVILTVLVVLVVLFILYQYNLPFMGLIGRSEGFRSNMTTPGSANYLGANTGNDSASAVAGQNQVNGMMNLHQNTMANMVSKSNPNQSGQVKETFTDLNAYEGPADFGTAEAPAGCYPRDQLMPSELLPKDMNSIWAQQNPLGTGSLKGKNFLSAGALIGVNTVGQSLRNANLQLRSEPPAPQVPVSIWNQSTITPDISHRPLEIGA